MKRLTVFTIAALLISFPAQAETFFFKTNTPPWTVSGIKNPGRNDVCVTQQNWGLKTFFSLYQDMIDGELYMVITNPAWNMTDPPGATYTALINFPKSQNNTISYEILSNVTIRIRNIKTEPFMKLFVTEQSMMFKMPGNIPTLTIPLKGTRDAFNAMSQCINAYESKAKGNSLNL